MKMDERFMSKVEIGDKCWEWKGQIYPSGYGNFWMNKKNCGAHRASYELFIGKIPKDMFVCHTCDNPSCVNPAHLFVGSPLENTKDMIRKGRQVISPSKLTDEDLNVMRELYQKGFTQRQLGKKFKVSQYCIWKHLKKYFPKNSMIGEENNKSKLTEEDVLKIRKMYKFNKMGTHRISKLFGVYKSTIQRVIKRKTWRHI